MAARINSKIRRQARRHAARRQVNQADQGQQDLFPKIGKMCVGYAVGLKKLAEIRRSL